MVGEMLLLHTSNGLFGVFYFMTLRVANKDQFCSDVVNAEGYLRIQPSHPPPPPQQQQHNTQRSTEEELRKAAGGKCYDTFRRAVQGWTTTDIDAISTVTQKSPIHMAAWKGNIHNLIYFTETLGCNINRISQMKYSYGKTCLFFALTQSRCDVVDYLLAHGAHVKIINNKGQSPLSIASSHFYSDHDRYIVTKIIQAEQSQAHLEWVNYRTSHSDHCVYGDLDPRFLHLERPIHEDTDVVTPYAINPTTKAIRRSGLYRKLNNFSFGQKNDVVVLSSLSQEEEEQQQSLSSTITKRKRNCPKRELSPADIAVVDAAWNDVKVCVKNEVASDVLMNHIWTIIRVYSKLQKAWIPEVVEKLRQIDVNNTVLPLMFNVLLSEASKVFLSKQDRTLIRRVYNHYIDPSCYRQQSEVDRASQGPSSTQQLERDRRLDDMAWHDAYNIVKDLYLQRLIAESVTLRIDNPMHNRESKLSSLYLSLPYKPIWVDTIEQLSSLQDKIKCTPLVAIDAEWHDSDENHDHNQNSMLSTLQIAIVQNTTTNEDADGHNYETTVWVIDLLTHNQIYRNMCESFIRDILSTKVVLGFSLSNDMKRLNHYCSRHNQQDLTESSFSVSIKCILDIQSLWQQPCSPAQMLGLARCVQDVMITTTKQNVILSKEYQCSDWGQRPLSPMQLQYAGLDAVIVLYLFSEQYRRINPT